ncbi:MAG: ABC transporter permease subunit [Anaerolineae bacterium]
MLALLVIAAPLLARRPDAHRSGEPATAAQRRPPAGNRPAGATTAGAYGGRHTLLIAALATLIAVVPGVALGLLGAVDGADRVVAVLINALLAFPGLLLALLVLTLLGQGAIPLALATGCTQIAPCARVTRSAVIQVRALGYVEAAGARRYRISYSHVSHPAEYRCDNCRLYGRVIFAYTILNSAALSFLGLGGEPGVPDWGVMLYEGRQAFRNAPWIAAAPGLGITLVVILVNRAADGLRRR